jgi:hypothetical protein
MPDVSIAELIAEARELTSNPLVETHGVRASWIRDVADALESVTVPTGADDADEARKVIGASGLYCDQCYSYGEEDKECADCDKGIARLADALIDRGFRLLVPVEHMSTEAIEAIEALDRLTQIALDNTSEDVQEAVYEDAKRVRAEWQAPLNAAVTDEMVEKAALAILDRVTWKLHEHFQSLSEADLEEYPRTDARTES